MRIGPLYYCLVQFCLPLKMQSLAIYFYVTREMTHHSSGSMKWNLFVFFLLTIDLIEIECMRRSPISIDSWKKNFYRWIFPLETRTYFKKKKSFFTVHVETTLPQYYSYESLYFISNKNSLEKRAHSIYKIRYFMDVFT